MKKILALVVILMMGTTSISAKELLVEGEFIISTQGVDSTLWRAHTDLPEDGKKPLAQFPNKRTDIRELSKVSEDQYVFSVMGLSSEPGKENDREIFEFNRKTGVFRRLREGDNPVYIPKHHKLIFESNRGGLYIADYDLPTESASLIGRRLGIYLPAIPVSDDEIVVSKYAEKLRFVGNWKYNIVTKKFTELVALKSCSLTGIWRSKTEQLLCKRLVPLGNGRRVISDEFYLTSLDGKREEAVPLNDVDVALYIEKYDVLIAGLYRISYLPTPHEDHNKCVYLRMCG